MSGCLEQVEKGVKKLQESTPRYKRPEIKSGLRGLRYFIEFPIVGKNIDAFSIILLVEKLLNSGKTTMGSRIITKDSYSQDDQVSYMIDYEVNSSTVSGGKSKGSLYLRGIRG